MPLPLRSPHLVHTEWRDWTLTCPCHKHRASGCRAWEGGWLHTTTALFLAPCCALLSCPPGKVHHKWSPIFLAWIRPTSTLTTCLSHFMWALRMPQLRWHLSDPRWHSLFYPEAQPQFHPQTSTPWAALPDQLPTRHGVSARNFPTP